MSERSFPTNLGIKVYVNSEQSIVIEQECAYDPEKADIVVVTPERAPAIIQWIQECLDEIEEDQ